MLFGPEDGEQFGDPRMDRGQPMKPGVAGGANGNQEIGITVPGMPVMNMKEACLPCPAARAPVPVALKHGFPVSGEVIPGMPAHQITLRTEAGNGGDPLPAGAKERFLAGTELYPGQQEAFLTTGEGRGCGAHTAIIRRRWFREESLS
jgi:hypothetical protein